LLKFAEKLSLAPQEIIQLDCTGPDAPPPTKAPAQTRGIERQDHVLPCYSVKFAEYLDPKLLTEKMMQKPVTEHDIDALIRNPNSFGVRLKA
jgi:hypothetical protein